jgi:thiol-disulfide isomerase/thioredoxin
MLVIVTMFAALSESIASAAPQIGDKAPAVKIAKWMTNKPPAVPGDKDAGKHVYLVEFWATWCGPCKRSIPHLAELHAKHLKEGLIVIGVTNEEPSEVEKFFKKNAGNKTLQMPYFVGCDNDMATSNAWTKDLEGIPHAFLVDKTGTVLWQGNPLADTSGMDDAIRRTLAGQYDVKTAKDSAEAAKKYGELMQQLQQSYASGDKEGQFKLLDRMNMARPNDVQPYLIRRHLLVENNMRDKIPAWDIRMESAVQDSATGLMEVVGFQLSQEPENRNAELLHRCAVRACALSKESDGDALSMLARVQCELGMIDAAIATEKKALALASGDEAENRKRVLAYYEAAKKIATAPQAADATSSR